MKKLSLLLLVMVLVSGVQATVVTLGSAADTYLRSNYGPFGGLEYMYTHGQYNFVGYLRFDLSAYNAADITDASLVLTKVNVTGLRNDGLTTGRFALHGLNNVEGNTAQNWNESSLTSNLAGLEWDNSSTMADSIADGRVVNLDADPGVNIVETISGGSTIMTVTGASLVSFLQARANDGGLATLIISFGSTEGRGICYGTKENTTAAYRPVLSVTVPEPATMLLLSLGGLFFARKKR